MDVQKKLDTLVDGVGLPTLDSAYDEIFQMNAEGQPYMRSLIFKALRWMMCSFRAISVKTLSKAVAFNLDGSVDSFVDEDFVLRMCSNLVVSTPSKMARFAHRSVREYLARQSATPIGTKEEPNERELAHSTVHSQVAQTCLAIVHSLADKKKYPGLPRNPLEEVKEVNLSGFDMYAVYFWAAHCEASGKVDELGNTYS